MATIAIVLAVGGASAYAANQLKKNSVGTKQLKKNSVTAKKIKKNAVTKAKIKAGAIDSSKIADGAVTGSDINAASTPFARVVSTLQSAGGVPITAGAVVPVGTYTQNPGEANIYVAGMDVSFAPSCEPPRIAQVLLLLDPANPAAPTPADFAALGVAIDETGVATKRIEFGPFPGSYNPLQRSAPQAPTARTFYAFLAGASCSSGSGVTAGPVEVDVIGTK
jgi:hypothetical protein